MPHQTGKAADVRPPDFIIASIEQTLGQAVQSVEPVGGGCIANASRVESGGGKYFLKWAAGTAGETFVAEGEGLVALASHDSRLVVPSPISMRNADEAGPGLLLMEWIEEDVKSKTFWENLGRGLAELHRVHSGGTYGFETDNFIGRLPQRNKLHADWAEFFAHERILPQVEMARLSGGWSLAWDERLNGLLKRLPSLLPARPHASLVHGDLWTGNVLAARGGRAAIVDPAVYRGHREVDLAMSELFGRFSSEFYQAYNSEWKVDSGYRDRRDVYNLYHLINHLNHFGSSYAGQVATVLKCFA